MKSTITNSRPGTFLVVARLLCDLKVIKEHTLMHAECESLNHALSVSPQGETTGALKVESLESVFKQMEYQRWSK